MEIALLVVGISACVAVLLGLLWLLDFVLAPEDRINDDWYDEDEGL